MKILIYKTKSETYLKQSRNENSKIIFYKLVKSNYYINKY